METTNRRKFTIADGMILVASTALALADLFPEPYPSFHPIRELVSLRLAWACLVYTITLASLRLRRPRPGRDDLWSQPGWVACSSVAIAFGALALYRSLWIANFATGGFALANVLPMYFKMSLDDFVRHPDQPTSVVISAWAVLALGGRWRAEPGWIDRAGRLVGLGWIALCLTNWIEVWFP